LPFSGDREIAKGDFPAQMHQVMRNLRMILEDAGSSFDKIAKMTVVLARMSDFPVMNEIYRGYFEPGNYPARITTQ
jgi:2-iminobutanoate/2-iminopropanoate deaminase